MNPGDVVVGDEDGVVVVPVGMVDKVIEVAEEGEKVDERCRADILEGKGVKETFAKHRGK